MYKNHRYSSDKCQRLKFKFQGMERVTENFSHVYQDIFALAANGGKDSGVFLEIGGFDPIIDSNTLIAEKLFGWRGISVDITDLTNKFLAMRPKTEFICHDAITLDYKSLFEKNNFPKQIDYLSLDIEPPMQTLNALKALPLSDYRFSVITFETDYYRDVCPIEERESVRAESRQILSDLGYVKVFGNVSYLDNNTPFEDWYLDNKYFGKNHVENFLRKDDTPFVAEDYMFDKVCSV